MTRSRWVDVVLVLVLVVGCFRVYRWSPGTVQMCDSCYSLAVSEKLLRHGTVRLDTLVSPELAERARLPGYNPDLGYPYHLRILPGNAARGIESGYVYAYPIGSSVLSVPAVAYYSLVRGTSALGVGERYDAEGERVLQAKVAAAVTAAAVGIFFLVGRLVLPSGLSFLLAAGFGLGSMAWSTMARALWSHTWAVLLLAMAIAGMTWMTREPRSSRSQWLTGVGIGTLLFWMVMVRPQTAISGLAVVAFLGIWHWRAAVTTCLSGGMWVGLFVAWSWNTFGSPTPPSTYAGETLDLQAMMFRAEAMLVSPSRGLLIFCPYLVGFAYLGVAYRRWLPSPQLLLPAGLAIAGYGVVFSGYSGWHGGYCYGPRHLTDLLPWFVLVGAIAIAGLREAPVPGWWKLAEAVVLAGCFAWAGFVHGRGAISQQTWMWNYRCRTGAEHARHAIDWRHPQFLAGLTYRVHSDGTFEDR